MPLRARRPETSGPGETGRGPRSAQPHGHSGAPLASPWDACPSSPLASARVEQDDALRPAPALGRQTSALSVVYLVSRFPHFELSVGDLAV